MIQGTVLCSSSTEFSLSEHPHHLQIQKLQIEGMQSEYSQHKLQEWPYVASVPSTVTTGFLLDAAIGFLDVLLAFPFPLTVVSMQIERMSHLDVQAFFHSAVARF